MSTATHEEQAIRAQTNDADDLVGPQLVAFFTEWLQMRQRPRIASDEERQAQNRAWHEEIRDRSEHLLQDLLWPLEARPRLTDISVYPVSIETLSDESLRQRARDAWVASVGLRDLLRLWVKFLMYAGTGCRIDVAAEVQIEQRFPQLADMGRVLDAVADAARAPEDDYWHRFALYQLGQEERALARYQGYDKALFSRQKFLPLITDFQTLIKANAHALWLCAPSIAPFDSTYQALRTAVVNVTRVDMRFGPGGELPDFTSLGWKAVKAYESHLADPLNSLIEVLGVCPTRVLRNEAVSDVWVDVDLEVVHFGELVVAVKRDEAIFFDVLLEQHDKKLVSKEIIQLRSELLGVRIDRVNGRLEKSLKKANIDSTLFIETNRGGGYRLLLDNVPIFAE